MITQKSVTRIKRKYLGERGVKAMHRINEEKMQFQRKHIQVWRIINSHLRITWNNVDHSTRQKEHHRFRGNSHAHIKFWHLPYPHNSIDSRLALLSPLALGKAYLKLSYSEIHLSRNTVCFHFTLLILNPPWGPGGLSCECILRIPMRVVKGD